MFFFCLFYFCFVFVSVFFCLFVVFGFFFFLGGGGGGGDMKKALIEIGISFYVNRTLVFGGHFLWTALCKKKKNNCTLTKLFNFYCLPSLILVCPLQKVSFQAMFQISSVMLADRTSH